MFSDFNKINKGFKKGFSAVYYAKIRCPVCKEEIFAKALLCPFCNTDFTKPLYNKRANWQNVVMKIILFISAVIGISICVTGAPVVIGILVGLALYGAGYFVVQRIQSFRNYHHK